MKNRKQEKRSLNYPHIASRVFDTPLLIEQSKLVAILNVLGPRLGFDTQEAAQASQFSYSDPVRHLDAASGRRLLHREEGHYIIDGVAVIPVVGTLVQRSDWMSAMSGMVGYGQIERMFQAALSDPEVKEIVMEIDSPGGEVPGAFDLADRMYEARGTKHITAVASEFAASAAYLIASAADEIVVPRTGYVGSIGVVGTHVDYSKAMEKRGMAVTFVYAGDKKVDGNPYQPLPDSVKAEWQMEIDEVYRLFVDTVARNRGIEGKKVRETQAGMFMGFKAVDARLADQVNSFANVLSNAVLRDTRAEPKFLAHPRKEPSMNEQEAAKLKAEAEAKAKTELEAKQRAEAEAKAKADAEAKAKAEVDAKKSAEEKAGANASADAAARERIKAILTCEEAKGREALASHLALETTTSAEMAKGILSKSPKASKLDEAMKDFQPGVKAEEVGGEQNQPQMDSAATIYERRAQTYAAARPK